VLRSAESGAGVKELLEVFARLMPNPDGGQPPPFLKGEGQQAERVQVTPTRSVTSSRTAFKISIDPFVGPSGLFRVHQGTVRTGSQLLRRRRAQAVQGRAPVSIAGQGAREISRAIPGDICAVSKVDELHFDAVLHDSHDEDHYHLKSITFPPRWRARDRAGASVARSRSSRTPCTSSSPRIRACASSTMRA
jgi:elongation factor G